MNRFICFRFLHIFLISIVMISFSLTPHPVYAWSAVTVVDEGIIFIPLNLFRSIAGFFTGKEVPQMTLKDLGTHQLMMKLAYKLLEKDPAYKEQKEYFPSIEGIVEWEGVAAKTDRVIMEGGEWRGSNAKSGGPDAAGKSKDSYHYLNAGLEAVKWGNADTSVERHFNGLLMQMYGQGDFFNRGKPNKDTNQNAAWAAHYLGDTYVPHHTVGRFKEGMQAGILTPAEAGPAYLYDFQAAVLEGNDIKLDSIVQPPEWSGQYNDFSDIFSYYRKYRADDNKDWFDPWYYSGPYLTDKIRMGPNLVLGSHQSWESWAHSYITDNNLTKVPTSYSKDWENATPKFNSAISNIENQSAMAKAFAIASAKETAANMAVFTKTPDVAFNKAAERVATLWRASLTALRPAIQVTTDPANTKLLHVVATIQSVEPVDPAKNVRVKLFADGGKVRGDDSPTLKADVTSTAPGILTWDVDASNPDSCKLWMEVICTYANTPDLQYSVVEPGKDRITVGVSPSQVKAGDKVKLTVKVQPAAKTELTVTNWGPLEKKSDLFSFLKKADLTTDGTGTFSGEFTVGKTTKDGSYDIKVADGKIKAAGSAKIYVGLNIKNYKGLSISFMGSAKHTFVRSDKLPASDWLSVMGNAPPYTKITSWEGDYTVNAMMVTAHPNETGTLKLTLDNNYETITSFTWEYKHTNSSPSLSGDDPKSVSLTITGGGLKKGVSTSYLSALTGQPDFYYKLTGQEVCSNSKIKETRVYFDGTTQVYTGSICGPNTMSSFLFNR